MPYTGDPNNPIDRVRLRVGDTNPNNEYLSDAIYQYLLSTYPTELRASIEAVRMIMAELATIAVRERVGQEEIYGQDAFENYKDLLDELEKEIAEGLGKGGIYAGGTSKQDFCNNRANPDNMRAPYEKGTITSFSGDVCHDSPTNPTGSFNNKSRETFVVHVDE